MTTHKESAVSVFSKLIKIGNTEIGEGCPPFVIAEMSGNHNQSLQRALKIVDAAAACGVKGFKIQTYTADTMTLDCREDGFVISDETSPWQGRSLHALYQEAYTPWDWHEAIFNRCRLHGMIPFSTPFDSSAVDFLESLGVDLYKIASFENTDHHLIRKVAATGKPVIISTGLANPSEIWEAVEVVRSTGNNKLILLKCTSAYPAPPELCNIKTISHMKELFGVPVGLSDHTPGIGIAVASVALNASVIEKHFTLSRKDGGVDSSFSLEPAEMKALAEESFRAFQGLGRVSYRLSPKEQKSLKFRRTLYLTRDIKKGEPFSRQNLGAIRPGDGLPVKYLDVFVGKTCKADVRKGTPLSWSFLQENPETRANAAQDELHPG